MSANSSAIPITNRLESKVVLITGGASGIDVQDELGHSVCKDIGFESISYIHCDVTNEFDVEKAVDMAKSKYGKLDVMFNNAGISGNNESGILESENEIFKRVLGVNCVSPFATATPMLRKVMGMTEKKKVEDVVSLCVNLKGAVLELEDIAEAALYLGSDESKYVSGMNLVVDGGYSLTNPAFSNAIKSLFS
ncbi:hypothetical protein ACJW30_09G059100 [Castanea mollissima]